MAIWKSRHWPLGVSIGIEIGIAKILFLPFKIFNEKVKQMSKITQYFF